MTLWQRRARLVAGISAFAMAAIVLLAIRERRPPPPPVAVPRADPAAVMESTGAVVIRAKGAQQDFQIEAQRQLTYGNGHSRLENVRITAGRDGRDFHLTADWADVRDNQARIELQGNLTLRDSDGLTATGERGTYDEREGIVRVPGPVSFQRGRYSGGGIGATYDPDRDILSILADAHISGDRTERAAALDITAGSAGLARRDDYLRFDGDVRIARGDQVAEAARAVLYLSGEAQHLELVELRGGSRLTGGRGEPVRSMVARDIDLRYADDGGVLRQALLAGAGAIDLAAPERRIAGERIDLLLGADGETIQELSAQERVSVDFPGDGEAPARRIEAATLDGASAPNSALEAARFEEGVSYHETIGASKSGPASGRTVNARTLILAVTSGLGEITRADFAGDVRLRDAELTATAGRAHYNVRDATIVLLPAETGSARPHVTDARGSLDAGRIEIVLGAERAQRVTAAGNVQSILRATAESEGSTPQPGGRTGRMPGMLDSHEPVYVTAGQMTYDETIGIATYAGDARLWQGERAVQGETIVIDERTGDLTAKGSARSRMLLEQVDPKTKETEQVDTIASADELAYDDSLRRATYLTNAHARGPQGDVTANRIELYLGEGADTLERAEAHGAVRLRLQTRVSTGDRLTYFGGEGRYVMGGTPVTIVEDLATECRETTGKTLTFFRSTDTITVDGNEEHRTQTKTGATCPEPPSF